MNDIVIADVQTARVLSQIQVAGAAADVSGGAVALLEVDEDALFGGGFDETAFDMPDNAHASDTSLFNTFNSDIYDSGTPFSGTPEAGE